MDRDGLSVIDVSNPVNPHRLGGYDTSGRAKGIAVVGNHAYVAEGWEGLEVFDVSNPSDPQRVGGYETSGAANDVTVTDHYAYLAGGHWDNVAEITRDFLVVIDVSNPTSPQRVGGYDATWEYGGEEGTCVAVTSNFAYVGKGGFGLHVIDVTNPAKPQWVGRYYPGGGSNGARAIGNCLYVATEDGVHVLDVTAPASPKLAGVVETGGSVEDVSVSGRYAYLADGGGLRILDVSDPARPFQYAVDRSNLQSRGVATSSNRLYVAGGIFQVFDIANPTQRTLLGDLQYWTGTHPYVAPAGDYLFTCTIFGGEALTIVDVRNPGEPALVGDFYHLGEGNWSGGMTLLQGYAFCARQWAGLQVLDLSLPTEPKHVGAYYPEAPVSDVAVRDSFAFLTEGSDLSGLEVIDIGDPQCPVRAAKASLPTANNVAMMGSYACVTGDGLQVFDVGDPYHPVRAGHHQLGAETTRLQVVGNFVYVAAGEYGLAIYRVVPQLKLNPPVREGNVLRLSWLGAPGLRLQQATSLSPAAWEDVPNSEGVSSLHLSLTNRAAFFRLVKP